MKKTGTPVLKAVVPVSKIINFFERIGACRLCYILSSSLFLLKK